MLYQWSNSKEQDKGEYDNDGDGYHLENVLHIKVY